MRPCVQQRHCGAQKDREQSHRQQVGWELGHRSVSLMQFQPRNDILRSEPHAAHWAIQTRRLHRQRRPTGESSARALGKRGQKSVAPIAREIDECRHGATLSGGCGRCTWRCFNDRLSGGFGDRLRRGFSNCFSNWCRGGRFWRAGGRTGGRCCAGTTRTSGTARRASGGATRSNWFFASCSTAKFLAGNIGGTTTRGGHGTGIDLLVVGVVGDGRWECVGSCGARCLGCRVSRNDDAIAFES